MFKQQKIYDTSIFKWLVLVIIENALQNRKREEIEENKVEENIYSHYI